MLPEVNRETNGELGMISPATSYIGLTRGGAGVAPGDPDRYYPATAATSCASPWPTTSRARPTR